MVGQLTTTLTKNRYLCSMSTATSKPSTSAESNRRLFVDADCNPTDFSSKVASPSTYTLYSKNSDWDVVRNLSDLEDYLIFCKASNNLPYLVSIGSFYDVIDSRHSSEAISIILEYCADDLPAILNHSGDSELTQKVQELLS
jgi:hypothetical protein